MRRQHITFLLCGLFAGLICVLLGTLSFVFLAYLVGSLFFASVVTSIAITVSSRYIVARLPRYFAGLLLSTITYVIALIVFSAVAGFSNRFGFRPSGNILDFRIDVLLGLIAAGSMGAAGIAALTALLTREWSTSTLLRLMFASLVTIAVTFIANLPFHTYWSFFGVLLPVGNALFCAFVGAQILLNPDVLSDGTLTAQNDEAK